VLAKVRVKVPDARTPEATPSLKVTLWVEAFCAQVHVTVVPGDT
jgi:hypothetical protein